MEQFTRRLSDVDAFQHMSARSLARAARSLSPFDVSKGAAVVPAGVRTLDVYFVLEGSVRVQLLSAPGRDVGYRDVLAGEYFGEIGALSGTATVGYAVARRPSRIARMPRAAFLALVDRDSRFARQLLNTLSLHAQELCLRVRDISALPVSTRIHHYLLRLADVSTNGPPPIVITNAPTQETIASFVGTHREAVAREMAQLRREGVIAYGRGRIEILDPDKLQRTADKALEAI